MEIPDKIMKKWEVLRSPGDSEKLAELLPGTASETFNRAFRQKKCSDNVFETMADFYKRKEALIKKYI